MIIGVCALYTPGSESIKTYLINLSCSMYHVYENCTLFVLQWEPCKLLESIFKPTVYCTYNVFKQRGSSSKDVFS